MAKKLDPPTSHDRGACASTENGNRQWSMAIDSGNHQWVNASVGIFQLGVCSPPLLSPSNLPGPPAPSMASFLTSSALASGSAAGSAGSLSSTERALAVRQVKSFGCDPTEQNIMRYQAAKASRTGNQRVLKQCCCSK